MHTTILPLKNQLEVDSSYSAISNEVINGQVRFACCTHMPQKPAVIYNFDVSRNTIKRISDTSLVFPEGHLHGKIHTSIVTDKEQISYCATHFAYPYGIPQPFDYPGSRLVAIDKMGKTNDLGLVKANNGTINLVIDQARSLIYLLTIPDASLIQYDIKNAVFEDLGSIPSSRAVSRNLAIDKDGNVFGCYEGGGLFIYRHDKERLELHDRFLPEPQSEQWNSASRVGVNRLDRSMWRSFFYCPKREKFFGLLSSESRAFSLDPSSLDIVLGEEVFSRQTPSIRKRNIFPTLSVADGENNLYYASSIGLFDYNRTEHAVDFSHLVKISKDTLISNDLGEITDGKRRVYGIMTAAFIDGEYIAVGAVERLEDEPYNTFNILDQKPFVIAIIRTRI
jgi:hypothetical protein